MSKSMVRGRPRNPEALHQLVRHRGIAAAIDLIAAATPAQVTALLDLDLWRARQAGTEERFDAERFGEWVEALVDADAAVAARIVAGLEPRLVIAGLSRLVRVVDVASGVRPDDSRGAVEAEIGGYLMGTNDAARWDAIVSLLVELEAEHPASFHAVMQGVRRLSNSVPEVDGLDARLAAPDQAVHDLALERALRRAAQGYCAPADARAFLALARRRGRSPQPEAAPNPIAAAYFRAAGAQATPELELAFLTNAVAAGCAIHSGPLTPQQAAEAVAATCTLGRERRPPAPPVNVPPGDGAALAVRSSARDSQTLIDAFEAGWATLHQDVCLFAADRLIALLGGLRIADTATDRDLQYLRRELIAQRAAGTQWRARAALDVVATLDQLAWIGLLGVLDECPTIPEALEAIVERRTGAISVTAFTFISSARQIQVVETFLARLPSVLM